MEKYTILCMTVLAGSIIGCQKPQLEYHPERELRTRHLHFSCNIDFAELPDLIPSVLENLGIEMEQVIQKNGNYECLGKSLSGEIVTVRGSALGNGKSFLGIEVKGRDRVTEILLNEIRNAIRYATELYVRDNKKS